MERLAIPKYSELPEDPTDRANVEHVLRHGYVILENCFTQDEANEAKAEIDRLSGKTPHPGRNAFEGFKTNRIYSLLNNHTWGAEVKGRYENTIPMECPSGSAVYFIGTTWHCGGANKSNMPRKSATVQYCQPYIRPIENQILAVDPRKLPEIPPRIVEMMGYRIHRPFIGYADGLNPRKAVERMIWWLRKPVDHSPPTFASTASSKL
ncbi:hypothetical protein FQN50_007169 [Emmonsiellopsis sp. PD_5]|nr:hypothetical protein FQN50_007169 [Emmonsiellopsis sp. PD_5]